MREGMGKFRGKDVDTGEWRFGFYMVVAPPKIAVGERGEYKHMIVFEGFADWGMNCNFQSEVDPATVGELVFSHDGKDYYEGDTVKASHGKCEIRFNEKRSAFMLFDLVDEMYVMNMEPYVYRHAAMYGLEVTGNVHDEESK